MSADYERRTYEKTLHPIICAIFRIAYVRQQCGKRRKETAAKRGFDVFYAWYTDTYSSYQYYAHTYQSPFRVVMDKYKDNSAWNGLLAAWRVATFDLESEAEYALKEVGYYETFLFDMLYDEKTGTMGSPFVSTMATATDTFNSVAERIEASALQELIETDAWVTVSTLFDPDDLKKQTALWNKVQTMDEFTEALEIIGDVSDYVGYCSSALDVIDRLSKLESLLSASGETKRILNDLYNNCTDNPALEYNGIVSDSMNKELLRGFMINKTAIGEIAQKMASDIYEGVVQNCNLYGFAFTVGQKMGKFTADGLFGTSDLISSCHRGLNPPTPFGGFLREFQGLEK